jgi:hypothetical protein
VLALTERYRSRHLGWNVKHFYAWYRRDGGGRNYSWVKNRLQRAGVVGKVAGRGKHCKRRERSPLPGMMLHQDGSTHEWVAGQRWDLIVTMDDATNEHYSMFFVPEEGTASSLRGMREVILGHGLFSSLYTDRGSHYWNTPEAGGKVDKTNLTQFGRAMKQLGIEMIPAYSPEAAASGRLAPIRGGCPRNSRPRASPCFRRPTGIWRRCIAPPSTPSSGTLRWKKAAPSCRGSAAIWMTFCASSMSVPWDTTTASASRARCCKYRPIDIAATMLRPRCGCIAMRMELWLSFMARAS